jgi:hypothetical protein
MNLTIPSNPKAIAELGEKIYDERYRAQYEAEQTGKFVAVNVRTEHATLGDTPEQALEQAKRDDPSGVFHLIRVGSAGAFRVGYTLHDTEEVWGR